MSSSIKKRVNVRKSVCIVYEQIQFKKKKYKKLGVKNIAASGNSSPNLRDQQEKKRSSSSGAH